MATTIQPPPRRFQFSLASIMACTLGCILAASLARTFWSSAVLPAWFRLGIAGFTGSFIAYFTLRLPQLLKHLWGVSARWRAVQAHRRELVEWAKARRGQPKTRPTGPGDGIIGGDGEREA